METPELLVLPLKLSIKIPTEHKMNFIVYKLISAFPSY